MKPLPSGARIRTIAMPTNFDVAVYMQTNAALSVNGWGTTERGALSDDLLTVRVPYSDQEFCRESYSRIGYSIQEDGYCAGFRTGAFDSCQGDSGGPQYFLPSINANGQSLGAAILTGVVSWGEGCANRNFPGIYTSIFYHKNWLESVAVLHAADLR